MNNKKGNSFIDTDHPKIKGEDDRFQRYGFAKQIARLVTSNVFEQSLVVGIYGKWGEGKTSLMNFIKTELHEDIVIVNFNPWYFNDQEQLINFFLKSIAASLNKSLKKGKEKLGKVLSDYGDAIGTISKWAGISLEGVVHAGDKLQKVSIEDLKLRADQIIKDTGKRIVVFIDDIDRLDVKEIQMILKLVKLVGDFPLTNYVLAFDEQVVAMALAPIYGNGDIETGYKFLEKIVQVPLKIPKATKTSLRKYTLDLLNTTLTKCEVQLNNDELTCFHEVFNDYYLKHIDNPRLAIRYANVLSFSLPLLRGEVNNGDLLILEGLKVFFPSAYDFVRYNPQIFLTDTSESKTLMSKQPDKDGIVNEIKQYINSLPESNRNSVLMVWQHLFPQFKQTWSNWGYSMDGPGDWYRKKRICSGRYFDRYFTFVVQADEIPDTLFDEFLGTLEFDTIDKAEIQLTHLFETYDASEFIFKLQFRHEDLSAKQSESLITTLIKKSDEYPIEPGQFSAFTTFAETARLISKLINKLPNNSRLPLLLKEVPKSKNLEFAMEIARNIVSKDGNKEKGVMNKTEELQFQTSLVQEFQNRVKQTNFFKILPDNEMWWILIWWRKIDGDTLDKTIKRAVNKKTQNAIAVIRIFTPTIMSWGGKKQSIFKSNFNQQNFESMASTIDVKYIYDILKADTTVKRVNFNLQNIPDHDELTDTDLVDIFMQFYERSLMN